ncbi:uncharacterized protein LOC112526892 [Cynara cardunculus var. scolymus]|uniref:Transmembrane protein n=1 Tax=Cynara cardunculus var. scolymus TaxID=59895 RepID=A0A103XEG8_CYNCS|nr:uncharacterized protein LOC112526892 [Cynara cardunculus var. scolymus]KVH89228.1 hypothetical protein Ccrd_008779 [Cynara cardunculus var. scolymus]
MNKGFWVLFVVFGTALLCVYLSPISDSEDVQDESPMNLTKPSRKLKESNIHEENGYGNVGVDDYLPNDPVPSSEAAALRPGPIEHGTPLMPYIPTPTPPGPNVGFP